MTDIPKPPQRAKPWVKLHLAKQTDSDPMPPFIIGILQEELPGTYCLTNVLEAVPDQQNAAGFRLEERKFSDYISRTYVWRVEMLGMKPDVEDFGSVEEDYGGM